MSSAGAAPRAAVPVSSARAEASRKNGAKSRGPRSEEGKARSAQNALKHGMRAQKYVVLPEEDHAEFADLEAALVAELAPVGALQAVLARRIAVAAWRLARADRIEVELFEERHIAGGGPGLALIRDGNGTRSFETLLRYRGAAMAEFWRALRTLKALQAEAGVSLEQTAGAALALETRGSRAVARRPRPNQPEPREISCDTSGWGAASERELPCTLHEPPARWTPNEPEPRRTLLEPAVPWQPNEPTAGANAKTLETRSSPGEITTWPESNQPEPRRQATDPDGRLSRP
jgi:hypothetical protein